jgi:GNAT superfamily N-acetyltransferase
VPTSDLPIGIRELGDHDVELVERLYAEVLTPAFPPDELEDPWWREPEGKAAHAPMVTIAALTPDRQVVGGIVGEWHPDPMVLVIAYLAVRDDTRGRGVGTALMEAAAHGWYRRFKPVVVLGELEDPRHHSGGEQDPALRLRFYARLGAKVLAVPYFQPRLRPAGRRVPHLLLGVFETRPPDASAVDATVLTQFLDEYVLACEGEAALGEPAIRWLRRFFTEKPEIALLPIERYEEVPDPEPPGPR